MTHFIQPLKMQFELFKDTMKQYLSHIFFFIMLISGLPYGCQSPVPENDHSTTDKHNYITTRAEKEYITLAHQGKTAPILISHMDYEGLKRMASYVQQDLEKVTTNPVKVLTDSVDATYETVIIAGTIGKSHLIDTLIKEEKIDVSAIKGKWEASLTVTVKDPIPGVKNALVIVGSDKRGTFYGLFDLSKYIGVSPWYWWADVPITPENTLYATCGTYVSQSPKVKYRGIFLNDEEPALGRWAVEKFGGFNHQFYEKVFELLLRLKGNYLWPAMWWASFNSDDPENPRLADEMGIVMGTSHHEPMMRAHSEWTPSRNQGIAWNYNQSKSTLDTFWEAGIQRMQNYESVVTIGMRGDGDEAMGDNTNIALLEDIVANQRDILAHVTGKPASETPQLWALYKEVQAYYDQGMRVPDDVTLLLCDDNWGNVRRLPSPADSARSGGYGMYYHFDYVGDPRNYKWINTNPLPRIWEQMHLTYQHGVDRIWLVNVGDLKPMELPISFFLDYAWNPDNLSQNDLKTYTERWAAQQFGPKNATDIADILTKYAKYNSRRKPELLSSQTYSLTHYREAERVVKAYTTLAKKAKEIAQQLPAVYQDAYFQLVLHPVTASANLYQMYYATAKNQQAAAQGRATTNDWADSVRMYYTKDSLITAYYHTQLANGKWNHMMAQTHIGYTYWQQPEHNSMPMVTEIVIPAKAQMGVSIDGSDRYWSNGSINTPLPELTDFNQKSTYIDLFNKGVAPYDYQISSNADWLNITPASGTVKKELRIWLSPDWALVPEGRQQVEISITQKNGATINAILPIHKPAKPNRTQFTGQIESNGYISVEATHYSNHISVEGVGWREIPDLGRTLSAMTPFPVTSKPFTTTLQSPQLEYPMYFYDSGQVQVRLFLSPTLNIYKDEGLKVAVAFDDQKPVILNMHAVDSQKEWEKWVSNNINIRSATLKLEHPGAHTLKISMIDPAVVLQKIEVVTDTSQHRSSYLGAPESTLLPLKKMK